MAAASAAPADYVHGVAHTSHLVKPAETIVHQRPAVAHVAETYHKGPAIAHTKIQHGVVGSRTVQVGSRPVQVGVQSYIAGQSVHQPAPYSYVAEPAKAYQNTVPIPEPALPYAAAPAPVIPPAPRNLGPAPLDTVTQEKILAPVRTHTVVTPRKTQIIPEVHVNRVPYDVPVQVPVPVQRDVIVTKQVDRPYPVEVPRAVPVAAPYRVDTVRDVVHTPVINKHTVSRTHTHHGAVAAPAVAAVGQY